VRTGSEPSQARSALRLRVSLAVFGLACAAAGVVVFAVVGNTGWMVGFVVLGLITALDLAKVINRIRQGPHYQPGATTPPYRSVESPGDPGASRRQPPTAEARKRRYLLLMGACLTLFVLAWAWVRLFSTTAAVVMTIIAMAIPPLAVIVANAGSPINRRRGR